MAVSVGTRLIGRFLGNAVSEAVAFGAGAAMGPVLRPPVYELEATVNAAYPNRRLDPETAAAVAAERVDEKGRMAGEAAASGIDGTRFEDLYGEALNAPGMETLYALWRRGLIGDGEFVHGLHKAKLEDEWTGPLEGLRDVLLSSEELAMAQQQGFVSEARANSEGALQGVSEERQQLRFDMAGLPPGVETALDMLRRGIIDAATFAQIVREGHTKTKYTDVLLQMRRRLLSAATYVRLFLKGWITREQMHAGGALWGYTPADMDQWYLSEGRPATVHQIHIGYARGARLPGASDEEDAILTAVKQSDIRPEYGPLLYAQRYTYPSAFVLRGLTESGAVSRDDALQALLFSGWEPTFAEKTADAWAGGGTGGGTDSHVSKAQTQLWTATHRSFIAEEVSDATATAALTGAGVAAASVPAVLALWRDERDLIRKQLSPTQIRKAMQEGVTNPATGAAWSFADAVQAMVDRGYTQADATVFMQT